MCQCLENKEFEINRLFEKFYSNESKSLLKKYLTTHMPCQLSEKGQTQYGGRINDVIKSGLKYPDAEIGVYATDFEAYKLYKELFDPIIEEYHNFKKNDVHPTSDFGRIQEFSNLDAWGENILSTRIHISRSIVGYPFFPLLTYEMYEEIEEKIKPVLFGLENEFKGTYYTMREIDQDEELQKKLDKDGFLFKNNNKFLEASGAYTYFLVGRGIFHNDANNFLVWINEQDHLQITSIDKGGHLGCCYRRLKQGLNLIEQSLEFIVDRHLGYVTSCPSRLGTTIRACVQIKLPQLGQNIKQLRRVANKCNLRVEEICNDTSDNGDNIIYNICNKYRLGLTEFEVMKQFADGITKLLEKEKKKTRNTKKEKIIF